jgi:hypothetical protein
VELVAMHKAKQQASADSADTPNNGSNNGSSNSSGNRSPNSSGKPAAAPAGSELGEVDSLGHYDPESDKFVGGSAGVETNGYEKEVTGEEQLALKRHGGGDMTKQGIAWGLLQLDLSFGWEMEDKPVEDVEQLLKETSEHAVAAAK